MPGETGLRGVTAPAAYKVLNSFLRPDARWLLSSFPAPLLGAFSLLTGCFRCLMVNALYFQNHFCCRLHIIHPSLSEI